jgi:transcription initiation factor IIF auxiliary subunit
MTAVHLEVRDSLFEPGTSSNRESRVVPTRVLNARVVYPVWIWLEGNDLPYVDKAVYELHPSFREPTQIVRRTPSNPDCKIQIWTWGKFELSVQIEDKRGLTYRIGHWLSYENELDQADFRPDPSPYSLLESSSPVVRRYLKR